MKRRYSEKIDLINKAREAPLSAGKLFDTIIPY
jgi:hypothetical protein